MKDHDMNDFATRVTFARAWNTYAPNGQSICNDTLALEFLPREHRLGAATHEGRMKMNSILTPLELALIDWVAVRTRVMDEFVLNALNSGVRQLVILGAGYDSRAYRLVTPDQGVTVFEVDRPAMQDIKRNKIKEALGPAPEHVVFVPLDFQEANIVKDLSDKGFQLGIATAYLWEGVSFFLDSYAVEKTLVFMAETAGTGSALAFDYVDEGVIHGTYSDPETATLVRHAKKTGEAFKFGINPEELPEFMEKHGLKATANNSAPQWLKIYGKDCDGLAPAPFFHVAHGIKP